MAKTELAYHFFRNTLRDGSPVPPDGEWLVFDGEPEMCVRGLHASRHPFDALQYAPGENLAIVEVRSITAEQDDKLVAKERMIVARIDAEQLLKDYAKWCALQVISLWDAPQVVLDFLNGDESKREAAAKAARDAAWAAAGDAAWAAAEAAAWAAARAARDTAGDAAWADQRDKLQEMVDEAFEAVL